MAIETRNGRTYYYRKHRVGGHVYSEYVGGGPLAEFAVEEDEIKRNARQQQRALEKAEQQRQAELEAQVIRACAAVQAILATELEAAGFHNHKGQWRKRYDESRT